MSKESVITGFTRKNYEIAFLRKRLKDAEHVIFDARACANMHGRTTKPTHAEKRLKKSIEVFDESDPYRQWMRKKNS